MMVVDRIVNALGFTSKSREYGNVSVGRCWPRDSTETRSGFWAADAYVRLDGDDEYSYFLGTGDSLPEALRHLADQIADETEGT